MMKYERNIKICKVNFVIEENLGIRNLRCTEKGFSTLNTLMSLTATTTEFISLIQQNSDVKSDNLYAHFLKETPTDKKGISPIFYEIINGCAFYKINIAESPQSIVLPQPFLIKALEILKRVKSKSAPVAPPWLFRKNSIHSSPCLLTGVQEIEKEQVQLINSECIKLNATRDKTSRRSTFAFEELSAGFNERLAAAGLSSNQYAEEKKYWLQQFECFCLAELYEEFLTQKDKSFIEQGHHIETVTTQREVAHLEQQLKKLNEAKQKIHVEEKIILDADITSLTRILYFDLELNGFLSVNAKKILSESTRRENYPLLDAVLHRIDQLVIYAHSKERKTYFPDAIVTTVSNLPFSIIWFSFDHLPSHKSAIDWLVLMEYYFRNKINQPGIYFFKGTDFRLKIQANYDDGINLRILSGMVYNID